MTTRRLMLTLTVGVALFACVAGLILEVRRAERAERTLEEIYQSALSETAEQMQALSLTLEKALVTGDVSQNVKLLAQVSQLSEDVRRQPDLSAPEPRGHGPDADLRQSAGGVCGGAAARAGEGGGASGERRKPAGNAADGLLSATAVSCPLRSRI